MTKEWTHSIRICKQFRWTKTILWKLQIASLARASLPRHLWSVIEYVGDVFGVFASKYSKCKATMQKREEHVSKTTEQSIKTE